MTYRIDNRWAPTSSGIVPPPEADAVYSARLIDNGDGTADIVPDRQGFAYNNETHRDELMGALTAHTPHRDLHWLARDEAGVKDYGLLRFGARRSAGYVYVCAWLKPGATDPVPEPELPRYTPMQLEVLRYFVTAPGNICRESNGMIPGDRSNVPSVHWRPLQRLHSDGLVQLITQVDRRFILTPEGFRVAKAFGIERPKL